MKLILVRHCETYWNEARRIQGSGSDIDLSETGRRQAACLGPALREEDITAVYSSPMRRAMKTATAIAMPHGLSVIQDPDLRELNVGEFESKRGEELGATLGHFLMRGSDGKLHRMPGGEGLDELQSRSSGAVKRVLHDNPSGAVVVVSHYFALLTALCSIMGFPIQTMRRLRLATGSISVIMFASAKPVLVTLNDKCHSS
ncbi:MAG: histidine phosphatase family protein [Chloroflexi bacterium]|nr:histidine phosphatase family protein [Chloroflexota bacterium]